MPKVLVTLCCVVTLHASACFGEEYGRLAPVLARVAVKFDCYFAVEEFWEKGTAMNELMVRRIRSPRGESLKEVIEDLSRSLPNVRVVQEIQSLPENPPDIRIIQDSLNDKLFHIVETKLLADPNYVMSRRMDAFDFRGTPRSLLANLSARGLPIEMTRVCGVPVSYGPNISREEIHVTAKNAEVRSIVAKAVTFDAKSSVIPIHTYTYMTDQGTPLTVVQFDLTETGLGLRAEQGRRTVEPVGKESVSMSPDNTASEVETTAVETLSEVPRSESEISQVPAAASVPSGQTEEVIITETMPGEKPATQIAQEETPQSLSNRDKDWRCLAICVAAGLIVATAAAWLLLRRRSGSTS